MGQFFDKILTMILKHLFRSLDHQQISKFKIFEKKGKVVDKYYTKFLKNLNVESLVAQIMESVDQTKIEKQDSLQGSVLGVLCAWNCLPKNKIS